MNTNENYVKEEHDYMAQKEVYRKEIISIFTRMEDINRLRFWRNYISAIENGEDN